MKSSRGIDYTYPVHLYVFKLKNGKCKVGIAFCPHDRAGRFADDLMTYYGLEEIVEIIYVERFPNRYVGSEAEREIHSLLVSVDYPKIGGWTEVFEYNETVVPTVKEVTSRYNKITLFDPLLTTHWEPCRALMLSLVDRFYGNPEVRLGVDFAKQSRIRTKLMVRVMRALLANLIVLPEGNTWRIPRTLTKKTLYTPIYHWLKKLTELSRKEILTLLGLEEVPDEYLKRDLTMLTSSLRLSGKRKEVSKPMLFQLLSVQLALRHMVKRNDPLRDFYKTLSITRTEVTGYDIIL